MLIPLKKKYLEHKSFAGGAYKNRTGKKGSKDTIWSLLVKSARKKGKK